MGNKQNYKQERSRKDPRTKRRRPRGKNQFTKREEEVIIDTVPSDTAPGGGVPDDIIDLQINSDTTVVATAGEVAGCSKSASAKKLKLGGEPDEQQQQQLEDGEMEGDFSYVLIDTLVFINLLSDIGRCQKCDDKLDIIHQIESKRGLCNLFKLKCRKCDWFHVMTTSRHINKDVKRGKVAYDVNIRTVSAFREIGRGYAAIETFCGFMNMPPPMNKTTYQDIVDGMHISYTEAADESMKAAACELVEMAHEDNNEYDAGDGSHVDVAVSVDGTWQKRGYASLNGAVTVIGLDNGKCLAYDCMAKSCKSCQAWENKKNTPDYEEFVRSHECAINHTGSAGKMEADGVVRCFEKSVATNGLQYTTYIGDGDSKAHSSVVAADPYSGVTVTKAECIGHIQKRVGSRLRKLKKKEGKLLSKLTHKIINKMQNYFGIAIRNNNTSVDDMKKAIGAVLYHCSEANDPEARHMYCDRTEGTWCKYWKSNIMGTIYNEKPGIPRAVKLKITPIFEDLSKDELLERCLHGNTQNNNEAINAIIWKKLPKDIFVGRKMLEIGISSAVINFNDGACGMQPVYKKLGLLNGYFMNNYCRNHDMLRIKESVRKSSLICKASRKRLHASRKGYQDKNNDDEGPTYGYGEH